MHAHTYIDIRTLINEFGRFDIENTVTTGIHAHTYIDLYTDETCIADMKLRTQ